MALARTPQRIERNAESGLRRELGLRDLFLFGIICFTQPRWLPAAAHAGAGSVAVWLIAGVLVGAPLAVAVPALMSKHPGAGGLYVWTRNDFGPAHGFLSFWIYWVSMAFWFPGAAMFYMSSGLSAFGPGPAHLADSRAFVIGISLAVIWIALGANMIGLKTGKWVENGGAIAVAIIGVILIAAAAVSWRRAGSATALQFTPSMDRGSVTFWAAMAYGITGAELFGMMSAEIKSPERIVKPAIWLVTACVSVFYAAATLAMLILLRAGEISELTGLTAAGNAAAHVFAATWIPAIIGCMLLVTASGTLGGIGSAISRMQLAAGADGLLPNGFARVHPRWHTPHVALITLAIISSAMLLGVQVGESARVAYQEIVSLMIIGGFLPYIYVFASSWKANRKLAACVGVGVTIFCLICSAIPSADVTRVWLFEGKLAAGTTAMIVSGLIIYAKRHRATCDSGPSGAS